MKNLITLLSIPLILSCSSKKKFYQKNDFIKKNDTIYLEKIIKKIDPLDTLTKKNAYNISKKLYKNALNYYSSGDTILSLNLFKKSIKMLSQSNMNNEDYANLKLDKKLKEIEGNKKDNNDSLDLLVNSKYNTEFENEIKTGTDFEKKVLINKKLLTTKNKKWFIETLKRTTDYFPYIDSLLKVNDIDPFVKWMYPVESAMKPTIRSRAGAAGISQFMRTTAKYYGLKTYGAWYDERLDAKKSIDASIKYMSKLYSLFNDPFLSIAAYNSGENGIMKRLKITHSTSYDDLLESKIIPLETQNHLPKIYAFMELAKEMSIPKKRKNKIIENILKNNFDIITVKKETDIDVIAKTLGISEKLLRNYNTAYQMPSTPPKEMVKGAYSFIFRVPKGMATGFEEKIKKVKRRVKNPYKYYTIRNGNTLSEIGKKFGINYKRIMKINRIKSTRNLKIGQRLRIPRY